MTDNPMIAFDCGECLGKGTGYGDWSGSALKVCETCGGSGKIRLTLDDLAERIAKKVEVQVNRYCATPGEQRPENL